MENVGRENGVLRRNPCIGFGREVVCLESSKTDNSPDRLWNSLSMGTVHLTAGAPPHSHGQWFILCTTGPGQITNRNKINYLAFSSPLAIKAIAILFLPFPRLSRDALRVLCPAFSFALPLTAGAISILSVAAAQLKANRRAKQIL